MSKNKLIIAGAGAGKTTHIVRDSIRNKNNRILITTYTQANEAGIREKFFEENGCVPENVTIQTWFSFLLQDGARPFQGIRRNRRIQNIVIPKGQSTQGISESDTERYYMADKNHMYSDKIATFAIKCNELSEGAVIERLEGIYDFIYVDEVQDISGYDLEFLKLIARSNIKLIMVGDPRQGTYSTNSSSKNKKFRKDKTRIIDFFMTDKTIDVDLDETTLGTNYRCHPLICDLSNKLYTELAAVESGYDKHDVHQGVFLIKRDNLESYLLKYNPVQLRWDRRTRVNVDYRVMNLGESKGLEFDRAIIYLTKPMIEWIRDDTSELKMESRSKLYVGITRARHSVAFVCDDDIGGITVWR